MCLSEAINENEFNEKAHIDTCTKIAFTFNGAIYKQRDGVCMGITLGPLLVTDLEEKVVKLLINDSKIKFYIIYTDDTLFTIKREDVRRIKNLLNNFNPNLRFTVDLFQIEVPHFLEMELSPDCISIFRKSTSLYTSLYTHCTSYVP